MAKASAQNVVNFVLLPEEWRKMHIVGAREFKGTSYIDTSEGRKRTTLVDLIFEDNETGTQIHQNYSIDKPSYLAGVLEAVSPGESADLLNKIDWATDDVEAIFDIDIKVKVYHDEFPMNSGRYQNRVGNVVALETNTDDVVPEDALLNEVTPGASPNRGIQTNQMPRGAESTEDAEPFSNTDD